MTLSRTARILIALLLVAAAAFLWINVFVGTPDTPSRFTRTVGNSSAQAAPVPSVEPDESADDAEVDPFADGVEAPTDDAESADDAAPADAEDGPAELPFITLEDGADPAQGDEAEGDATAGPAGEAPTVVAPDETAVVGRDVIVAEFPFLITAPPLVDEEQAEPAAEAAAGRDRPGSTARATLNPFSPIVVQTPAGEPTAEAAAPPPEPQVVEVEVPNGPPAGAASPSAAAAAPSPDAPAPRALVPASPRPQGLPRQLASGTLPVAPSLLREPRAEAASVAPVTPPAVAVREPDDGEGRAPLPTIGTDLARAGAEPAPLAPGQVAAAGPAEAPLVAGADPLSRYLRNQNVTFTGSVVGSVGVGVFRVDGTGTPIVLALGQSLPDSDIVLTDLRGQAAEFTLGDTSQVLNLDLRR